jgi:hypothetical protein
MYAVDPDHCDVAIGQGDLVVPASGFLPHATSKVTYDVERPDLRGYDIVGQTCLYFYKPVYHQESCMFVCVCIFGHIQTTY